MKYDETGLALEKPSRDCARVDCPLPYIYEMRACPRISGYVANSVTTVKYSRSLYWLAVSTVNAATIIYNINSSRDNAS